MSPTSAPIFSHHPGHCALIGMVHVGALPGTPRHQGASLDELADQAVAEALIYAEAGLDAVMIENMHDRPFLRGDAVGHEITAAMAVIGRAVRQAVDRPTGLQVLASANRQALAAAHAGGLDFIRAEGFVFAHVADEGLTESCAGDLLRYRKQIGAENVRILTDIKKKHSSHAITADISLAETAAAAEFFLSDGLILTGATTGDPADANDLRQLREQMPGFPLFIGSGVTAENAHTYRPHATGLIIGSHFKKDGHWSHPVDRARVLKFLEHLPV